MTLRSALVDALALDSDDFRDRVEAFTDRHDVPEPRRALAETTPKTFDGPEVLDDYGTLPRHTRELVWRLWLFDTAPVGLTVTGPAYEDTPLVYATRTFRELTGYSMAELRGENPRLLQGPETATDSVDDLREAISIWTPVTVELRNYRRDGTPFRNRVSLVPIAGEDGTIRNWIGVHAAVHPTEE